MKSNLFIASMFAILAGVVHSLIVFGWVFAHYTVGIECQRLGAFYVGDKTFECKEKK